MIKKPYVKLWEYNENCFSLFCIIELSLENLGEFSYAEFKSDDCTELNNSWINHLLLDNGLLRLECSLIHKSCYGFSDFYIALYDTEGSIRRNIQISDLAINMPKVTSGILSYHRKSNDTLKIDFWSKNPTTSYQLGTKLYRDHPKIYCEKSDFYYTEVETAYPLNRNSISSKTDCGDGQYFQRHETIELAKEVSDPRIAALKDIHKGKVGWIIGNGPSVQHKDLDMLENEITFAFNRFYLAFNDTKLRPTYTFTADEQVFKDFGQEMIDANDNQSFIASTDKPSLNGEFIWLRQYGLYPTLFSQNPDYFVTPGGSSVYVAMQLAFHMGIRKLYFYGADFNFNFKRNVNETNPYRRVSGDGNHFIKGYRSGKSWCPPTFRHIANSFWTARCMLEANGGFIKNVTQGGQLEIFERQSFSDALIENNIIKAGNYE